VSSVNQSTIPSFTASLCSPPYGLFHALSLVGRSKRGFSLSHFRSLDAPVVHLIALGLVSWALSGWGVIYMGDGPSWRWPPPRSTSPMPAPAPPRPNPRSKSPRHPRRGDSRPVSFSVRETTSCPLAPCSQIMQKLPKSSRQIATLPNSHTLAPFDTASLTPFFVSSCEVPR
jgi:hypothetical protein